MSVLPPTHSPKAAWQDLRAILRRRSREQAIALVLSILFTVVIIVVFFLDAKVNTAPPVTVTYVDSWSATRTDAEIKADQVKDQEAREERARVRQEQFKEIANSFGIEE
jgi:flagellar biosynthesis/type III secretory pathway M-ring protein FliF/YscJ